MELRTFGDTLQHALFMRGIDSTDFRNGRFTVTGTTADNLVRPVLKAIREDMKLVNTSFHEDEGDYTIKVRMEDRTFFVTLRNNWEGDCVVYYLYTTD